MQAGVGLKPPMAAQRAPTLLAILVLTHVTPTNGQACTAPKENCIETGCCEQPATATGPYGCFRRVGRHYAQCRPLYGWLNGTEAPSGECVDDDRYLCPQEANGEADTSFEECSASLDDCTHTLCCRNPSTRCYRRPDYYYAQCRADTTPCTPWDQRSRVDSAGWLCPGWEECGGAWGECTLSRCCADEGFSCYLNKSSNVARQWYAECRPDNSTQSLACAAAYSEWLCPESWMQWKHELWESATHRVAALSPGMIIAIVVNATLVAVFACMCLCVHRRRMRAQLHRLEAELEAARRANARPGTDRARILETELSTVNGHGDDELDVEVASAPARRARPKLPPSDQAYDMED